MRFHARGPKCQLWVKTDCSINETVAGLSYCFGDQNAKAMFMKDPKGNLADAAINQNVRSKG